VDKQEYKRFWVQHLAYASTRTNLHAAVAARPQAICTAVAAPGVAFSYGIQQRGRIAEIVFNHTERAVNQAIYDYLLAHREKIDAAFGAPLVWQHEPEWSGYTSASIGCHWANDDDFDDPLRWPNYQHEMVAAMVRLEAILNPYLKRQLGAKYRQKKRR
jgi:hypothetical protein